MKTNLTLLGLFIAAFAALSYAFPLMAASPAQMELQEAIRHGDESKVTDFLSKIHGGFDLAEPYIVTTDDKLPAICYAASLGHVAVIELLATFADEKLSINALETHRSSSGTTALQFAAMRGHLHVVKYILDKHPEMIQQVNSRSWSALSFAAEAGHCDTVECLLKRRAEVDGRTNFGSTPLALSSQRARADIALPSMLMAAKADVNATDRYGRTALAQAVKSNNSALVELFLGNQELAPNHRETALDMALAEGRKDVALLLLKGQDPEVIIGKFKSAASLDELFNKVAKKYRIILDNDGAESQAFIRRFLSLIEPSIEQCSNLETLNEAYFNVMEECKSFREECTNFSFLVWAPLKRRVSQKIEAIFIEFQRNMSLQNRHFPGTIQASLGASVKVSDLSPFIKAEIQQHLRALFSEVSGAGTEEQLLDIIQARILSFESLVSIRDFEKTIEPWFDILHGAELLPSRASLEKTLFELRKKWFLQHKQKLSGIAKKPAPVAAEGSCFVCGDGASVMCVAGTAECDGKICTTCVVSHLDSIALHPTEGPSCQTCKNTACVAVYVQCDCSPEKVDLLREIKYRLHQEQKVAGWRFCHTDKCLDGRVFEAGEPKRFACSLCSFSGCLDCGSDHGTENYTAEGNCCRVEFMSTRYCELLLKQGRRRPLVLAELAPCPTRTKYNEIVTQHADEPYGRPCPRCSVIIRADGHRVLDHVRPLIEEYLEQCAAEHADGNPCPICAEAVDDKHKIQDHIHDGRSRPCPFCGMVIEKIPTQEGGHCNHMKCQNQLCARDFNFHTGKTAPHESNRSMDEQRYELDVGIVAWWPQ